MKLKRDTQFYIAKNIMKSGYSANFPLDYSKWVEFVNEKKDDFIWYENTEAGIETANEINEIPEDFKESVIAMLNKIRCYREFDKKKGYYNIICCFSSLNNLISIDFERKPKLEDLKIFLEMANHLDALLLKDGEKIIDENIINQSK